MSGGLFGGSSRQTTTSSSEPWEGAQPTIRRGLDMARNVADNDSYWQPYTGSTVVPWSGETTQAMGNIAANANNNMAGRGLSQQYQNVINAGGFNASQSDALRNTRNLANSQYAVTPELQRVLDQNAGTMRNSVNLNASQAGRYGSGSHTDVLTRNIGEMSNNAILSDYQNFLGRRDAANNNLFSMGQQGFGNLGTAYTGMNAPAQDLMTVGAMNEDLATRQMNDSLRIFNEQQNLPRQRAEWLTALANGSGSLGGTTRQTQPGQNPFLTALGYGATGLGLLGF